MNRLAPLLQIDYNKTRGLTGINGLFWNGKKHYETILIIYDRDSKFYSLFDNIIPKSCLGGYEYGIDYWQLTWQYGKK